MKLEQLFEQGLLPAALRPVYQGMGLDSLFPPQALAVENGLLAGKNLLLAVPTASGKTLMAEFCMLKALLEKGGHCLYIVPLKALASEKYEDFKKRYEPLGIKVGVSTGDENISDRSLSHNQILIATAEKVDSLLRNRARWLITNLQAVVFDEIHFINDESRGPTLEILVARIKQLNPKAQVLGLSATVKNAEEIAAWLGGPCVLSPWRPIPLREGVYWNEVIRFALAPARMVREEPNDDLSKLALDTLRGRGQILVFVNSRRSAQAAARQLCSCVDMTLTPEEKARLAVLAKEVVGSEGSATKICRKLGEVVAHGVAFHHAGLKPVQRKLVEDHFKGNLIKVICSTPTLAAGVNLPARRAIIRDCKRYEQGLGSAYIPTSEYKQCAGRAGRPQYDEYGEAVLIAKSLSESKVLFDRYIMAGPEPVVSKLGAQGALRIHILASIAGSYVHDVNETFEFLSHTFFARQNQHRNLIELISQIFDFLVKEEFIEKSGFRFMATPFGAATSRLYIDPLSAIILRSGLKKIHAGTVATSVGLLQMLCCCPDCPTIKNLGSNLEPLEKFAYEHRDESIITPREAPHIEDYFAQMSVLKTVMMLQEWISEEKEEKICDDFNVGPGDVYRHTEGVRWLLYAAIVIADLLQFKSITFPLANLKNRVQYGIKEELLPLVQLKGIGRIRARNLFNKGFKDLVSLRNTDEDQLCRIAQIGRSLAKDILAQVSASKVDREAVKAFSQRWE